MEPTAMIPNPTDIPLVNPVFFKITDDGIAIRLSMAGDLKADLYMRGSIGFDTLEKKLLIENFGFDVNTEESLVNAADWFGHDAIIDRLKPYMTLSRALGTSFLARWQQTLMLSQRAMALYNLTVKKLLKVL